MADPSAPIKLPSGVVAQDRTAQFEILRGETNELTRKLLAKFGKKYVDITRQFGAVEYILNDDKEIVDIMAPVEYVAESDEFAIGRHLSGEYGSNHFSISAAALSRLASGESNFYATQALQLRHEPSFLRDQVVGAARHRPELAPDAEGKAPTVEDLLKNPRFVSQECRFVIHNLLSHLGVWTTLEKYLADIADLDHRKGRFGALKQRKELMSCVKFMIEQEIGIVEKRVRYGIILESKLSKFWKREFNYPDWTGARLYMSVDEGTADIRGYLTSMTLDGALFRFAAYDLLKEKWTPYQSRIDLLKNFDQATKGEIDGISEYLLEQLTQLKRLEDFSQMLAHPDMGEVPSDLRYTSFGLATKKSEKILNRTTLERYITNIQSLEKLSVLRKIWNDIDTSSKKECKLQLEELIGFAPVAPRWYPTFPPPLLPGPQCPSPPEPALEFPHATHAAPPAAPPAPPTPIARPVCHISGRRDPKPVADIKPYWERAEPPIPEVTPVRQGPKIKTRPADSSTSPAATTLPSAIDGAVESKLSLPMFWVGKRVFRTFERIFSGGLEKGQLDFSDFAYAMTNIGFSLDQGNGSSVTFYPPSVQKNAPLVCHQPHGSRKTLDPVRLREYASLLSRQYGWSLPWFGLKSDAPEGRENTNHGN